MDFDDLFRLTGDSFDMDRLASLAAAISSAEYVAANMRDVHRFDDNLALLSYALEQARPDGLHLEFGVASGRTINHMASRRTAATFHGFDSFEGLPEAWRSGYEAGAFRRQEPPAVAANVRLVVGRFDRTLPEWRATNPGEISFLHVDCDLYSSTQTVLAQLKDRICPGTVIAFDEYLNFPGWQRDEFRAFQEFCAATGTRYRYIGLVPRHQQAAVVVTG